MGKASRRKRKKARNVAGKVAHSEGSIGPTQVPASKRLTAAALIAISQQGLVAGVAKTKEAVALFDPDHRLSCRECCDFCCRYAVRVRPFEVMGIAGHLRANLPAEEFSRVRERIRSVAALYRIMDEEKRKEIFTPCPLLDNHRCGVYSIRPAACTGMTSYEAKDCDPASSNETVKVNPDIRHAAWGFAEAYDKHRAAETDTRRGLLEFVTALDAIVDDPACRIESWLAGEDVFAGAWISETPGSEPLKIGFL